MIELKFFDTADFERLISWIDSPELLLKWGGPGFHYPLDEGQLNIYKKNSNHDHAETLVYNVIHQKTGEVLGHISLGKINRKNRSARIGKVLIGSENIRGQGIGQRMMKEILKVAFDELQLHRVSLGVFDFNIAAIMCYEKVGFKKEGLLRDTAKNGDEYWSLYEMSILEEEWRRN
ncbi:GNAT family N-acetyltransferase [Salipaludibacillus neizhouensis]|uniref:GNAT family N-acetyltransferase n=1 Tax=Salipaludibacillus neizhouensis TaxID=885475 RepID=A0A3A9K9M4_9BACI|nr:GNAT family protein [Salipaludibacillus neizhouensis]RKL67470.1 GNAT family N-acetyltransferase [Salipaludibacillus neizhouensis]